LFESSAIVIMAITERGNSPQAASGWARVSPEEMFSADARMAGDHRAVLSDATGNTRCFAGWVGQKAHPDRREQARIEFSSALALASVVLRGERRWVWRWFDQSFEQRRTWLEEKTTET
jgi:hypothetical protein